MIFLEKNNQLFRIFPTTKLLYLSPKETPISYHQLNLILQEISQKIVKDPINTSIILLKDIHITHSLTKHMAISLYLIIDKANQIIYLKKSQLIYQIIEIPLFWRVSTMNYLIDRNLIHKMSDLTIKAQIVQKFMI